MKATQSFVIHVLLGVAVVTAIALLYLMLAHDGEAMLSPSAWAIFGGAALALLLAASAPSLVRRGRHLPPSPPLSHADIGFCIMVAVAGCTLAVVGVVSEMWLLMTVGIMLAPLAFLFRDAQRRQSDSSVD